MNGAATCWPKPGSSAWHGNSPRWPGHRGVLSGPSGGAARPPAEPSSCARDWSSDGATGQPFVEHLGSGGGFFNLIRIYPTHSVGVAVMGNATSYPIDAVARLALTD